MDRQQANYLLNVLRLKSDDRVLVFNGKDGEWLAKIVVEGRKACSLVPVEQTRSQGTKSDLIYCFAPIKHARLDYMVQKATEMGVGILQPVLTQHTQVRQLNSDRMRSNVREAAEQCGILNLPSVREPITLETLVANWDATRSLIFADESAAEQSPVERLRTVKQKHHAILIGPEGGFSEDERDLLIGQEFVIPLSLGPRILRADTAAVAAMALFQAVLGDFDDIA